MYIAKIKQEGQWWIGFVDGVEGGGCNSQESTRAELLDSLTEILRDFTGNPVAKIDQVEDWAGE